MDQILRLNDFFVEGGNRELSHVLLHIDEPTTPEEAKKGYFFALSETNHADLQYISKFQEIIERAETEYYEIEDNSRDPFELILEKINGESFILENEKGELNSIVGAIREKEIIFSYFGRPQLLLFYKKKQGGYELMDLVKNGGEDATSDGQLFSQIIQGKLTPNDFLFVGTPHITDYFSHDRLEKIITTRPPEESAGHIEKVLSELKNGFSFGGLIIHLYRQEQPEKSRVARPTPGSSSRSLQKLFSREQSTAETLSPSLLPKIDKIRDILNNPKPATQPLPSGQIKSTEIKSSHLNTSRTLRSSRAKNAGDRVAAALQLILSGLKAFGKFILQLLIIIYTFLYGIFRYTGLLVVVAINYKNRRNSILENWRMGWRAKKENFRRLSFPAKLMFFGSIILFVVFSGSVVLLKYRQKISEEQLAFNNSIRDLRANKDSIESAIIYKNDELALNEFRIANEKLSGMICKTSEQKNICENLRSDFSKLETKLMKVTAVDLTTVTAFPGLPDTGMEGIIRAKNKIVAFSPATSTLFVYDLQNGESKQLPTYPSISGFTEAAVPKENDYAIFLYNQKQLVRLGIDDLSTRLAEISFASANSELTAFSIYNRRLYALDTKNGTILKHDSIKTGFGQGTEWLKTKDANLLSGSDLTIDGDVFVTRKDGGIEKFTAGEQQPFETVGLNPALSSPAKIWTYADIPYLYILEPAQKRLVIFEKNGHFVGQFTSPQLVSPSGFSIDFQNRTAYLIDSRKLLKFTLPKQ